MTGIYGLTVSVHKSKKFWPNAENRNSGMVFRPPTTVSKRMESEDPDKMTYVFAWRWKPYGLAVAISAPPVETAF